MRTSTGLALLAAGAVLLLAVHSDVVLLKLVGLALVAAGLAGLRALQLAYDWLRRSMKTQLDPDQVGEAADGPLVPLDTLLDPAAEHGATARKSAPGPHSIGD
jgi:cation transporter-like permease